MDRKVALQLRNEEPWREMTGMMARAGFKYVAMSFGDERPLLEDNWREYVSDIDRVFKEKGVKPSPLSLRLFLRHTSCPPC